MQSGSGETAASIRNTVDGTAPRTIFKPFKVTSGRLYVSVVILAGTLVLVDAVGRLSVDPPGLDWWLLLGLTLLSGTAVLHIPSTSVNFSISDVFTLTSAVVFGPAAGVAAVAVDCLAISYRLARNRLPVERVLFNAVAPPLAMWLAAHLFVLLSGAAPGVIEHSVERMVPALLLAAGVYFLLNTFAVALAIALHERVGVLVIWKAHCGNLWFSFLGGAVGAAVVVFALQQGFGTLVLGLPLLLAAILHFAYRNATGRVEDQLRHLAEVNRLHLSTVESLAHAIDAKDAVTHNHIRRVQTCALVLARRIGLTDELQLRALEAAALLHDIGKLAVPEHILNKPGRLTPAEFERMKTHAAVGAEILSEVEFPYPVVPIVRHHHESWDGSGYPDGLRADEIPIGARILSVIDCYDALTSDRPYRRALRPHPAFEIIRERRGTMYDPMVVDAFEEIYLSLETEASSDPQPLAIRLATHAAGRDIAPGPSAMTDAGAALKAAFDLGAVLGAADANTAGPTVWEHLQRIAHVDALAIYVPGNGDDRLRAAFAAGVSAAAIQRIDIAMGERLSGWVAATGQPMMNADAALDFVGTAPELRSAVVVPAKDGEFQAVVAVYSRTADAFDEGVLQLLLAIGPALARRLHGG
jgi:putative nucleotidyltransferase with HDIG domain